MRELFSFPLSYYSSIHDSQAIGYDKDLICWLNNLHLNYYYYLLFPQPSVGS